MSQKISVHEDSLAIRDIPKNYHIVMAQNMDLVHDNWNFEGIQTTQGIQTSQDIRMTYRGLMTHRMALARDDGGTESMKGDRDHMNDLCMMEAETLVTAQRNLGLRPLSSE